MSFDSMIKFLAMRLNATNGNEERWTSDAMFVPLEHEPITTITCIRVRPYRRVEVRRAQTASRGPNKILMA